MSDIKVLSCPAVGEPVTEAFDTDEGLQTVCPHCGRRVQVIGRVGKHMTLEGDDESD